jgi:diacylglycerol kinase (ATP)
MKALLIRNKCAGDGSASRAQLSKAIRQAGWKLAYLPRRKADAEAIAASKAGLIAVAGGDGTVAEVARILPDRSIPLAIIPTGTANNIARALGICGDLEALIAAWDMERRRRLDIGEVLGPWGCRRFVEGVGFGAFAEALRRVDACKDEAGCPPGREAFREALAEAKPLPFEIAVDSESLGDTPLMLEVMNIPLTGPRLPLAPDAQPGDGMLHISRVPVSAREAMMKWLGDERREPPLEQRSGREIRLVARTGAAMRIDDEALTLEPGAEVIVRLESEPVQILAPAEAPALAA